VWIVALLWTKVLSGFEDLGLIEDIAQQELVTLFQGGGDPVAIGLLVIAAVVLAPIVEELIFRGCLYRFLKSQTTLLPAQIASGLLFSMIHWNLLSFLPLVIVGIFLARVYEKTGSILVAIWFHAFFNAFSLGMLFVTNLSDVIPQ
jgi:membrane protease YdiL (CAAX protease family)